jgi:hypothetical protein
MSASYLLLKENKQEETLFQSPSNNQTLLKEDATHILTSYRNFDAMKEGFITLKIARRFKFKTIKFKVFRDQNYDRIFILLEYDKALEKLKSLDTKDCTFRQLYIYNQITNKKRFLEYLIFNFFIYKSF